MHSIPHKKCDFDASIDFLRQGNYALANWLLKEIFGLHERVLSNRKWLLFYFLVNRKIRDCIRDFP